MSACRTLLSDLIKIMENVKGAAKVGSTTPERGRSDRGVRRAHQAMYRSKEHGHSQPVLAN
jgi:hypothetical protein